ncbi:hypothetical protein BOX15_Mlig011550g1 [Macrostomum lignano]|uniref:Uncharacterized protein n=1 Tax=Macrostomum lignano TaxID=282301 RepID=A0A267EJX7_9PLAT|nr:hypothetical protein BOX15_Mlig011550g1 [Macrostomum lignano]
MVVLRAVTVLGEPVDQDSRNYRSASLSRVGQLEQEAEDIQRSSRLKDHHLLSSVDHILRQSQSPFVMYNRASSLPPQRAGSVQRFASPSPYDANTANFYYLPTSHLRASSVTRSAIHDTQSALDGCRKVLRRSSVSSGSGVNEFGQSGYSPATTRAINHAYAGSGVQVRVRNIPLPRRPGGGGGGGVIVDGVLPNSAERRRIERHLDSLVSYEMPSAENFTNMKNRLRDVNEKVLQHKLMMDRYTGVDLNPQSSVDERINDKYLELVSRMPELERNLNPGRRCSADYSNSNNYAVKGYSQGLLPGGGPPVSELRGRIRRLITRSRHDPNYFRQ